MKVQFYDYFNFPSLFCSLTFSVQALDWPTNDLNAVEYYLYVGEQEPFIFKIDVDPVELLNHGFNPENPTKIFAHGYVDHAITYTPPLNEAYNNDPEEHYNVIGIEWYRLANIYNYIEAATNTNRVGAHVGSNLVSKIFMDELGQTSDQIHAIGHSLGAHLVGHIGRAVQAEGKDPIKRVTALDPAKPFFDIVSLDYRVQPTDAVLVDVIHTNSGDLWESALSMPWVVGDVDFFPNGGEHQPGCTEACIGTACLDIPLIDMFNGKQSEMNRCFS